MWQAAREPQASDKTLQCFGFSSDDEYTQGIYVCVYRVGQVNWTVFET